MRDDVDESQDMTPTDKEIVQKVPSLNSSPPGAKNGASTVFMGSAGPRSGALAVHLPKKLKLPNSDPKLEDSISAVTDKRDHSPPEGRDLTPNTALILSPPTAEKNNLQENQEITQA